MFAELCMFGFTPLGSYWSPLGWKPSFWTNFFGFQKSIPWSSVSCTFHGLFCPLEFTLKPVGLGTLILDELVVFSVCKKSILQKHVSCILHGRFCPLRVHIKARWSWNPYFGRVRDLLSFKISIWWNHFCWILHSRFPPFEFILRPIWAWNLLFWKT